jgi:hypothetical protein
VSHNNGVARSNQTYVYGFSSDLSADLSGENAFRITDVSGLVVSTFIWTVDLTITVESGASSGASTQTLSAGLPRSVLIFSERRLDG